MILFIITVVASFYVGWRLCKKTDKRDLTDEWIHIIFVGALYFIVLWTTINITGLQEKTIERLEVINSKLNTSISEVESTVILIRDRVDLLSDIEEQRAFHYKTIY